MKRGSLCKKKGMGMDMAVSIKQLIDKLELQNLTPEVDITGDQGDSAGYQQTCAAACGLF